MKKGQKDNLVDLKNTKGKYDLVLCAGTFGHIPSYLALETLRAFKGKLKDKGYILVHFWIEKEKDILGSLKESLYNKGRFVKKALGLKIFNVNCSLYTKEEIKDMCDRCGLEIVKVISDFYLLKSA